METIIFMSPIDWVIFFHSLGAHIPLVIGTFKDKRDTTQTFQTWFLYFLLDIITFFTSNEIGGSYIILFGFACGSFIMALILFYQKRYAWTKLESVMTGLVFVCICIWVYSGPYWAMIFGILSEVIVSVCLIIKTFYDPRYKYNLPAYIIFLITSIITCLSAKNSSIQQLLYPLCETILCTIIIIPLLKKWWEENSLKYLISLSILLMMWNKKFR